MKVSNETKVGALTAISIVLLIIGFNLLKGKTLFSHNMTIYAVYTNVDGLSEANEVQVSGLSVGSVSGLTVMDRNVGRILVRMSIKQNIDIPKNSVANIINEDLLGTKAVRIDFGNSTDYLKSGDTIFSQVEGSLTDKLMSSLQPVTLRIQATLGQLDSVLLELSQTLDPATRGNLRAAIASLSSTMQSFSRIAVKADRVTGNLDTLSVALKNNAGNISTSLDNVRKLTASLSNGSLDTALDRINNAAISLDHILDAISRSQGSVGLLVNDKTLYNNLQAATASLNKLLEDLRLNPKRYVHFSLFGKKDKTVPLPADSTQHP